MSLEFTKEREFTKRIADYLQLTKSLTNNIDQVEGFYTDQISEADIIGFKKEITTNLRMIEGSHDKQDYINELREGMALLKVSLQEFTHRWQHDFNRRNPEVTLNAEKIKMHFFISEVSLSISDVERAIPELIDKKPLKLTEEVRLSTDQEFLIDTGKITSLYNLCNSEKLFAEPFSVQDFFTCFDVSKRINNHPKFKPKIKFVYILTQINATAKIALVRFGIPFYAGQKRRVLNENKPDFLFRNKVIKIVSS
jgi:hypothetical protein